MQTQTRSFIISYEAVILHAASPKNDCWITEHYWFLSLLPAVIGKYVKKAEVQPPHGGVRTNPV